MVTEMGQGMRVYECLRASELDVTSITNKRKQEISDRVFESRELWILRTIISIGLCTIIE